MLDRWCSTGVLKDLFPAMFSTAHDKGNMMANYFCWHDGSMFWDVHLIQPLHDWELQEMIMFLDLLYSSKIKRDVEDQLCW